jgi:hypothetical protein
MYNSKPINFIPCGLTAAWDARRAIKNSAANAKVN